MEVQYSVDWDKLAPLNLDWGILVGHTSSPQCGLGHSLIFHLVSSPLGVHCTSITSLSISPHQHIVYKHSERLMDFLFPTVSTKYGAQELDWSLYYSWLKHYSKLVFFFNFGKNITDLGKARGCSTNTLVAFSSLGFTAPPGSNGFRWCFQS